MPSGLVERIVVPGRLGLTHRVPESAEVEGVVSSWAARAGVQPHLVKTLLGLFAGEKHARVCLAGAPRCTECGVSACKRQRHR